MNPRRNVFLFLCLVSNAWFQQITVADNDVSTTTMPLEIEKKQHNLPNAVNDFGYKLLIKMMHQNKDDNIVISPTSIAGLLAMTLLGSVGNTYEELANVLGFSQDILKNRNNHEEFGEYLQRLNSNGTTSKTLYADAIFVDVNTQLREVYRSYLSRVYHGDVHSVEFSHDVEVKEIINEWVKAHTEGKIDTFLKEVLPKSTKIVLLSALYFSGQWAKPFIPEYTRKMPFRKPNNEVLADLMLNWDQFSSIYSKEDDTHMIAFPYNDTTTMYVLKPTSPSKTTILELMERLNYSKIDNLISRMTNKKTVVRFPKMALQSSVNLEKALEGVGVKSIFIPGGANFALMVDSDMVTNKTEDDLITRKAEDKDEARRLKERLNSLPNPGMHVDAVIHDVKLTIDEFGTEAAAVTSGLLARTAEQFYTDSPFYMFIRNENTKLVTFSAVIFDPTAM